MTFDGWIKKPTDEECINDFIKTIRYKRITNEQLVELTEILFKGLTPEQAIDFSYIRDQFMKGNLNIRCSSFQESNNFLTFCNRRIKWWSGENIICDGNLTKEYNMNKPTIYHYDKINTGLRYSDTIDNNHNTINYDKIVELIK